jgi:hypothetical protein
MYESPGLGLSARNSEGQQIREFLIESSFENPNITTIKMLLDYKLMTAQRGLKEFVHHTKPNKEILDLLLSYGPNNISDLLFELIDQVSKNKETMRTAADTINNVMNNLQSLQQTTISH